MIWNVRCQVKIQLSFCKTYEFLHCTAPAREGTPTTREEAEQEAGALTLHSLLLHTGYRDDFLSSFSLRAGLDEVSSCIMF